MTALVGSLVLLVAVELLAAMVGISGGCVYLLRTRRRST